MRDKARVVARLAILCLRADPWNNLGHQLSLVVAQLGPPLSVWTLGLMIDAMATGETAAAVRHGITIGLIHVLAEVVWAIQTRFEMRARETAAHAIDLHVLDLMGATPGMEHFERPDYADKLDLLEQGRYQLGALVHALMLNVAVLVHVSLTTAILARVSPWLVGLALCGVPTVWASARRDRLREATNEALTESFRVRHHLLIVGTGAAAAGEVRVFGLLPELRRRLHERFVVQDNAYTRLDLRAMVGEHLAWLVFAAGFVGAVALTVQRAIEGSASPGDVMVTLTFAGNIRQVLASAAHITTFLVTCVKAADRLTYIRKHADRVLAAVTPSDPKPAPEQLSSGVAFEGVTFRYPGTDVDVLHEVNVHLPAGATVALVGDNGAGKSTLVKLLARFYEPTHGRITVDGIPLTDIPIDDWCSRLSAGFQDFARPQLLAQEVVGVGRVADIESESAVTDALARADASTVIDDLPAGLATQVGTYFKGGAELSVGQWQKLALGRGMMRQQPLLLLLDEPTAALDARTEHALFERYAGASRRAREDGGIVLLVSHRFSTVRMADLILVIEDGCIAEQGSHSDLMALGGVYAELFTLQARAYR